jgi:anti-anti-sigma factor
MGSLALNELCRFDDDLVLTVSGIVDDATVEYFEQGLTRAAGNGSGQVIVDLTACWLDSAGLEALARLRRRSNGHSEQTRLLVRDADLFRMLQIVGLTSHFPTFLTTYAAAAAAPPRSSRVRATTALHSLSEAH